MSLDQTQFKLLIVYMHRKINVYGKSLVLSSAEETVDGLLELETWVLLQRCIRRFWSVFVVIAVGFFVAVLMTRSRGREYMIPHTPAAKEGTRSQ